MKKPAFTLIELLVAMSLAGVVFMIISTLFLTVFRSDSRGESVERTEQVRNDLFVELSNAIRWAAEVDIQDDKNIKIKTVDGENIHYHLTGNSIRKDGDQLTPDNVEVSKFVVTEYFTVPAEANGHSPYPLVGIEIGLRDKITNKDVEDLDLFVAMRKTEVN